MDFLRSALFHVMTRGEKIEVEVVYMLTELAITINNEVFK
jgi:hypothetical protein